MAAADIKDFEITRHFDRPRSVVWSAWSQPGQFAQWWGPRGCRVRVARLEFRPGGFFHYAMAFENAQTWWGRFNYREIVELERIVWLNSFSNERCGIARAPFSADCPLEIENTVVFTEHAGGTNVSLRARPFGELDAERKYFDELRPSLTEGYGGTFDQLAAHLAGV
jgi:uncharacterized protein YndB with AHSA1/START domain